MHGLENKLLCMVSRKIHGLVGAARGLQEKIRRVQIFEDVKTFDISKFRGFLNVDLGMTGGSVIQRFSPSQIWKNYKIGAGVARDATKNSLVGALQGKIKRNFRFSGFSFFPKSRFSGFSKMARCRPVIIWKLGIFIVSVK